MIKRQHNGKWQHFVTLDEYTNLVKRATGVLFQPSMAQGLPKTINGIEWWILNPDGSIPESADSGPNMPAPTGGTL